VYADSLGPVRRKRLEGLYDLLSKFCHPEFAAEGINKSNRLGYNVKEYHLLTTINVFSVISLYIIAKIEFGCHFPHMFAIDFPFSAKAGGNFEIT
jgi:hypothetical protein